MKQKMKGYIYCSNYSYINYPEDYTIGSVFKDETAWLNIDDIFHDCHLIPNSSYGSLHDISDRHIFEVALTGKIDHMRVDRAMLLNADNLTIIREITASDMIDILVESATNQRFLSKLLIHLLLRYPKTKIAPAFVCLFPEQTQLTLAHIAQPQVCKLLIQSPYPSVRKKLIQRKVLSNKDLNQFVYDPSIEIRATLAQYGTDSHRQQLAENKDAYTRLVVLPYANSKLIDTILETETDASVLARIFQEAKTKEQQKQAKKQLKALYNVTIIG